MRDFFFTLGRSLSARAQNVYATLNVHETKALPLGSKYMVEIENERWRLGSRLCTELHSKAAVHQLFLSRENLKRRQNIGGKEGRVNIVKQILLFRQEK